MLLPSAACFIFFLYQTLSVIDCGAHVSMPIPVSNRPRHNLRLRSRVGHVCLLPQIRARLVVRNFLTPKGSTTAAPHSTETIFKADFIGLPLFFCGTLLTLCGLAMYLGGILFSVTRLILGLGEQFRSWNMTILWYSGVPSTAGIILGALDLALLLPTKRRSRLRKELSPVVEKQVVVALTAYNDAPSIGQAVADFRNHPRVSRVIVVDNNSSDETLDIAQREGARAVTET